MADLGEALRADAGGVDGDEFAGLDFADEGGADDVEGAGLGGDDPAVVEAAEDQRADAVAVAGGVQGLAVGEGQAEGALEAGQQAHGRGLDLGLGGARQAGHGFRDGVDALGVVRVARGADAGVVGKPGVVQRRLLARGRAGDHAGLVGEEGAHDVGVAGQVLGDVHQPMARGLLRQLDLVDEVAVVPQRDVGAVGRHAEHRLCVLPRRGTRGGVAGVPDGDVALEGLQRLLVEHLGHEAQVLEHEDLVAVADGDAGGFLAAVLQREQAVVGQLGDVFARRPHAEHAAFLAGFALALVVQGRNRRVNGDAASVQRRRTCVDGGGGTGDQGIGHGANDSRRTGGGAKYPARIPHPRRLVPVARPRSVGCVRGPTAQPRADGPSRTTGRCAANSPARVPDTSMWGRASAKSVRPRARRSHSRGGTSTTFGGVPRVCRGPSMHCTATNGGTRSSTLCPGASCASIRADWRTAAASSPRDGGATSSARGSAPGAPAGAAAHPATAAMAERSSEGSTVLAMRPIVGGAAGAPTAARKVFAGRSRAQMGVTEGFGAGGLLLRYPPCPPPR